MGGVAACSVRLSVTRRVHARETRPVLLRKRPVEHSLCREDNGTESNPPHIYGIFRTGETSTGAGGERRLRRDAAAIHGGGGVSGRHAQWPVPPPFWRTLAKANASEGER